MMEIIFMYRTSFTVMLLGLLFFMPTMPVNAYTTLKVNQELNENKKQMKSGNASEQAFRKTAPQAGVAPKVEIGKYREDSLENGLQLIVVENHKLPRVSIQLFVDRPPVKQGDQAGYVEISGMLLKAGTQKLTKAELDEEVDFRGASLSTHSKGIKVKCLSKHKESLLSLIAEMAMHATFPEEEFQKAIKQKLSAIEADQNNPSAIASNIRKRVNFGQHPYGEFATKESVSNIQLDQCKDYYQKHFHPNHSYLVIVGDIKMTEAKKLAGKYFGSWERGELESEQFDSPSLPDKRQVVMTDLPAAVQSVINVTYPLEFHIAHEDYIPAMVMNHILGGGVFSGYLMQNLREDKGYTYGARSQMSNDPYVGYFNAYANVGNDVTEGAIREFLREMNRIRNEKVEKEHMDLVKKSISGSFARSLEDPQTLAKHALLTARFDLPEDYFSTYIQQVEEVTVEKVQEVARKYIRPSHCHVLVVGNKDAVAEEIKKFDGDETITFYSVEGKKVDVLQEQIPEGIRAEEIINNYLEKIGGEEKLKEVESLVWKIEMELMSMKMQGTRYIVKDDRYADISEVNGMEVRKIVYNNGEGYTMDPRRGKQIMTEEDLQDGRMNAHIFKELYYDDWGFKTEITGVDKVDDEAVYKVKVTGGEHLEWFEYYSRESGLKLKEVRMTEGPNGPMPITTRFMDYEETGGILFPGSMTVAGPFPDPMKMKTQEIEIDPDIKDSIFKLEEEK